jgi:hypothetical protein
MVPKSEFLQYTNELLFINLYIFYPEIKSKRVRIAHKHRILGRIKDHQRKERRAARKNPSQQHSKSISFFFIV